MITKDSIKAVAPEILYAPSLRLTIPLSPDTITAIKDAVEFVSNEDNGAIGLAANQIGRNEQWFVMLFGDTPKVIINPIIIGRIGNKTHIEKCFSEELPAKVRRSKELTVKYTEYVPDSGEYVTHNLVKLDGLSAQVFQHEYEHLKGKTICTNN